MITVSISGRKATLLKTADLPSGNNSSIKVNFIFSDSDAVWEKARKVAMFSAVTPKGLRKNLPAVIDEHGECVIPGKILSTPFSKVCVGVIAAYEDGSTVSTDLVFVNKTTAGAGGDSIYDEEELPMDRNDFELFLAELSASIGVQLAELQNNVSKLDTLEVNEFGNLEVNGETVLDYAQMFHLMSRQSEAFCVKQYWDLLQYDANEEKTDPETGEKYTHLKTVDLRPHTLDGDTVFVKSACGNYVRQNQIENLMGFVPELNIVYPLIHFWQDELPAPTDDEERVCAYAVFETFDGITYSLSRYYSSDYGTWVIELDISNLEGVYVYSWEDTSLLEKGGYVYLKDGEKVERENWPKGWPFALDVKCVEIQYPEKLSRIFFDHWAMNDHPPGRYVFDSKIDRWKRKADDMISCKMTIAKDSLSWDNRKTYIKRGCVPSDEISLSALKSKVKFSVVDQGYGYITVEASEPLTEDVQVSLTIRNTVERNDTYGLWSEW